MSLLDEINQEQALAAYNGEDRLERAITVVEADKANRPTGAAVSTGLPTLDTILRGGFYPGQLVVVSGTTGHGKTTLCRTFTTSMIVDKKTPIWLSYELQPAEFAEGFKQSELEAFVMPMKTKARDIPWIENKIVEGRMKFGADILFIDHLHRIINIHGKQNMSTQIGQAVGLCKEMALAHNMIIVLVCHTMKTKPDSDEELDIGSVRDSSFIEQEADVVLYTWRWSKDNTVNVLKVAKNRRGGSIGKKIALVFDGGIYLEKDVPFSGDHGNGSRPPVGKWQAQGSPDTEDAGWSH